MAHRGTERAVRRSCKAPRVCSVFTDGLARFAGLGAGAGLAGSIVQYWYAVVIGIVVEVR